MIAMYVAFLDPIEYLSGAVQAFSFASGIGAA